MQNRSSRNNAMPDSRGARYVLMAAPLLLQLHTPGTRADCVVFPHTSPTEVSCTGTDSDGVAVTGRAVVDVATGAVVQGNPAIVADHVTVTNRGRIEGDVSLIDPAPIAPEGNTFIDIGGTVTGTLTFGDGRDVLDFFYDGSRALPDIQQVVTGAGADTFRYRVTSTSTVALNPAFDFELTSIGFEGPSTILTLLPGTNPFSGVLQIERGGTVVNRAELRRDLSLVNPGNFFSSIQLIAEPPPLVPASPATFINEGIIETAFTSGTGGTAIEMESRGTVINQNIITVNADQGSAIRTAGDSSIENIGAINLLGAHALGILSGLNRTIIDNSGQILGSGSSTQGVILEGTSELHNSGAIDTDGVSVTVDLSSGVIQNTGLLRSHSAAVIAHGFGSVSGLSIINEANGVIDSLAGTAIDLPGAVSLYNAGRVTGDVNFASGIQTGGANVVYSDDGVIEGNLDLGGGDDLLLFNFHSSPTTSGPEITGSVTAGDGIDALGLVYQQSTDATFAVGVGFEAAAIAAEGTTTTVSIQAASVPVIVPFWLLGDGTVINHATLSSTDADVVRIYSPDLTFINEGALLGTRAIASDTRPQVINHGRIEGAVSLGGRSLISVAGLSLMNTGEIRATGEGYAIQSGNLSLGGGTGGVIIVNSAAETGTLNNASASNVSFTVEASSPTSTSTAPFYQTDITNQGSISADYLALVLAGSSARVTNSGTIIGGIAAIEIDVDQAALENSGTIRATANFGYALFVRGHGNFVNSGVIEHLGAAGGAVILQNAYTDPTDTFTNSGTIRGNGGAFSFNGGKLINAESGIIETTDTNASAVRMATQPQNSVTLINAGRIVGVADVLGAIPQGQTESLAGAIKGDEGQHTIINSGIISGSVALGPQTDSVESSGRLIGDVALEGGDDVMHVSALKIDSTVNGLLDGGNGVDTLQIENEVALTEVGFVNFETVTKRGGGKLALAFDSQAGQLDVAAGNFAVPLGRTLTVGELLLESPAILSGNGQIIGNVHADGTLAPGASIGTLTINGDLILQPGSRFVIEFDSLASDIVSVTGRTTLNGATLVLDALDPLAPGNDFQFLTSGAGVLGSFGRIETSGIFDANVIADATGALRLAISSRSFESLAGPSPQARQVAASFDALRAQQPVGAVRATLNDLARIARNLYPTVFAQLHPEAYASAPIITSRAQSRALDYTLARRLDTVGDAEEVPVDTLSAWIEVLGSFGDHEGRTATGTSGIDSNLVGTMVGLETWINPRTLLGSFIGEVHADHNFESLAVKGDTDNLLFGAYGAWRNAAWHTMAILKYGVGELEVSRNIAMPIATGRTHAEPDFDYFATSLVSGYRVFESATVHLQPELSFEYVNVTLRHAVEDGLAPFNLELRESSNDALTLGLGATAVRNVPLVHRGVQLDLRLTGGKFYEVLGDAPTATARFVNLESAEFTVNGAPLGRDAWRFGLGAEIRLHEHSEMFVDWQYATGDHTDEHAFRAGFKYAF